MTLLSEAKAAVEGPRQENYGHPKDNFERIAQLWGTILERTVTVEEVTLCMIALKIARLCNAPTHRDSYVDIAGYAAAWGLIDDYRKEPKDVDYDPFEVD